MNNFEQIQTLISASHPAPPLYMNIYPQLDALYDPKLPINFISERLHSESTQFNSKIFFSQNSKSSGCSETLSVYANPEEETGTNDIEDSDNYYKKDKDYPLLNKVLREIKNSTLDELLDEWWVSKEIKDPVKNADKIRFKNTKTPEQLAKLQETIVRFPYKFPKKERVKFANEIGLDEVQVYKWYYDNNPNKRGRKSRKDCFDSFDSFSF